MKRECSFCGKSFFRSDRALLSDKYCPNCIKDRIRNSGAVFFKKNNVSLDFKKSGYVIIKGNN